MLLNLLLMLCKKTSQAMRLRLGLHSSRPMSMASSWYLPAYSKCCWRCLPKLKNVFIPVTQPQASISTVTISSSTCICDRVAAMMGSKVEGMPKKEYHIFLRLPLLVWSCSWWLHLFWMSRSSLSSRSSHSSSCLFWSSKLLSTVSSRSCAGGRGGGGG